VGTPRPTGKIKSELEAICFFNVCNKFFNSPGNLKLVIIAVHEPTGSTAWLDIQNGESPASFDKRIGPF